MAPHHNGAALIFLTLILKIFASPLTYSEIAPNDEVTDLLAALLDDDSFRSSPQDQGIEYGHASEIKGWSRSAPHFGQIAGIAVDRQGRPVIFQRGPVSWLLSSFNTSNHYQLANQGPIPVDTVLTLHPASAIVIDGWGRNLFYLPHGIAICPNTGDTWLTDVALHQVFKFSADDHTKPVVTLGEKFTPGSDVNHFCKPTSIAIASNGDVFIGDGYCNQRILHFSSNGQFITELGKDLGSLTLNLPHGVALIEDRDVLCIADREERRIIFLRAGLIETDRSGQLIGTFQDPRFGPIYGIDVAAGLIFGVALEGSDSPATGFTLDPTSGNIVDMWSPRMGFHTPHDIAVTQDGTTVYVGEIGPNRVTKFLMAP